MPEEIIITPAPAPAPEPEPEPEPEAEELDLVAELVARESIEREEQHDEVMEAIAQCQTQLQSLTDLYQSMSHAQNAENPMLAEIQRQITEVRTLQESLKESMGSKPSNPNEPSNSPNPGSRTSDLATPGHEIVSPESEPEPPAPKRRRFRKI